MEENENNVANTGADVLKDELSKQLEKMRRQGILIGAQASAKAILEKMYITTRKKSKVSFRDYVRLFDDIEDFCVAALSRTLDDNGELVTTDATQGT